MNKLEQEKNMLKPIEIPQTQFDKELPTILQRTSCGIASLYTGLRYLGYNLEDFPLFARDFISIGQFTVPTYYIGTNIRGMETNIPVDYLPKEDPNDELRIHSLVRSIGNGGVFQLYKKENTDKTIQPQMAFTISKGFDHRGVQPFLESLSLPLKATIYETNELPDKLEEGSIILASLRQNELGYPIAAKLPTQHISTHIVPILQIGKIGETNVALFSDPAFIDPTDALQVRDTDSLRSCTEKFTVISPN